MANLFGIKRGHHERVAVLGHVCLVKDERMTCKTKQKVRNYN